jgi:hypothetical protein
MLYDYLPIPVLQNKLQIMSNVNVDFEEITGKGIQADIWIKFK